MMEAKEVLTVEVEILLSNKHSVTNKSIHDNNVSFISKCEGIIHE